MDRCALLARTLLAPLLIACGGCASSTAPLEVTWLANEGVLLACGERQVLIDAFVPEAYSIYTALPPATAQALLAGEPPFDDIELALVSHVHRDHFQPQFAQRYLAAHPGTRLVASPQVVELLGADSGAVSRWPAAGKPERFSHAGITVELLELSHGIDGMQNLGHIVTLGGFRILHLGDAEIVAANFAPYGLAGRDLDVALIPYWYFASAAGRALIATHLDARLKIAVHIPRAGEDDANLEAARAAGALVPTRPLQSWTIERR